MVLRMSCRAAATLFLLLGCTALAHGTEARGTGGPRTPQFFTTDPAGETRRTGHFADPLETYFHLIGHRASDGDYVFQVTDPSGRRLLSADAAECRVVRVESSRIVALRGLTASGALVDRVADDACNTQEQPDGAAGLAGHHDTNTDLFAGSPGLAIQLMPFERSPNPGGVHKLWLTPWADYLARGGDPSAVPVSRCPRGLLHGGRRCAGFSPDPGFRPSNRTRTKNFKVARAGGNRPPVADAGPDRTVAVGGSARLDGTRSFDPDGDPLSYSWALIAAPGGSAAMLLQPTSANPVLVTDLPGDYTVELVVDDGQLRSTPDEVVVSTRNSAPIADAGPDQSVRVDATVTLDGSGSTDADNDPLTYFWQIVSQPMTSVATLSDPTLVGPTFKADRPGRYVIELVVDDGFAASAPDVVVVDTINSAPVADAGPDQVVVTGMTVQLDGTGSTDVDGDPLSYFWSLTSIPAGSAATITEPTVVLPTLDIDLPGSYIVQLVVNDGSLDSVPDTMVISTTNTAPVADAGPDQSVALAATVTLDGSGSSDVDGDPLAYSWALVSRPAGSAAELSSASVVMPTFIADEPGTYVAQLVVDDGQTSSAPDTVTISTLNSQPVADAGPDQATVVNVAVTLDGTGSFDPDGDPLTYAWSMLDRPLGSVASLSDATTVTPSFLVDVSGDYVVQLIVDDGLLGSTPDTVLVSTINSAPVADAGPDQVLSQNETATLDGSGSFDPDGDLLSYFWSLSSIPSGSSARLSDPLVVDPTLVADLPGSYVAQLIVSDGFVDSAPDSVVVSAVNNRPIADAGPDQGARVGESVTLDGTASFDPDGSPLTYAWSFVSQPPTSTASLDDPESATPSFAIDVAGTYELSLTVSDGLLDSVPDLVIVATLNSPPVADAGPDQSGVVGEAITLDGSGSSDADGDPLTYQWTLISTPVGSAAALSSDTEVMPTFSIDLPGSYVAELIVNDGAVDSAADSVTVSTLNSPPVADAGPDQSVPVGVQATLDGSGSSDVDGDPLTYAWTLVSTPQGSTAALSDPSLVMPSFTLDLPGAYVAQLVVDDGTAASTPDTVTVATSNSAPIADAGPDQTLRVGALAQLDGSGSSDVDGDPLTFFWSLVSTPPASTATLDDSTSVTPTFLVDLPGTYVAQLIVEDGTLPSQPDTVSITTTNSPPVADAGPTQNVATGATVQLDGSNSSDADGDPLTYSWSFTSMPPASTATLAGSESVAPTFVADRPGLYVIQLIVHDGALASAPDTVSIFVGNQLSLAIRDSLLGFGRTTPVMATLSQPAPAGGQIIDLAVDDPIAQLSTSQLSYAPGETVATFDLLGLAVGSSTLRGSGPGIAEASAVVEVTSTLISFDVIRPFAPNEQTSAVLSITDPAPPQGLVVTLTVQDTGVATISPPTVFVPAGQFTPTANSQLTGIDFGTTTLRATAPGYAPDTRTLRVALEAVFDPATLDVPETQARSLVLRLDSPAPPGGVTFDLSVDDPLLSHPAQATVLEGQTQSPAIEVTGLTQGTTTLRAISPVTVEATASIDVVDLPDVFVSSNVGDVTEAVVGLDLQGQYAVRLETAPTLPVDVLVSVPASSGVLLSRSSAVVGSPSILYEDVVTTIVGDLWIQGTALGDDVAIGLQAFERNTTSPAGYESRPTTADVDPSGVALTDAGYRTTTFSAARAVFAGSFLLWDDEAPTQVGQVRGGQQARAGITLSATLASSAPLVAVLPDGATGTLEIDGGQSSGSILVEPLAEGTTEVSITVQPPGMTTPLGAPDRLTVTVDAPDAGVYAGGYVSEASVGLDLQAQFQVFLETAPPQPVDLVLSVPDGSGVLLSASATSAGSGSLAMTNVTSVFSPLFWIQGLTLTDDVPITLEIFESGTTTPIGYSVRPSTVEVEPSGIATQDTDYTTTSFSSARNITFQTYMLFDSESSPANAGAIRAQQPVRGGHTIDAVISTDAPGVALLPSGASETLVFQGSVASRSVLVEPVGSGVATIALVAQPPGLTVPTNVDDRVVVTVTAPEAYLSSSLGYVSEAVIGFDLQAAFSVFLEAAPPSPVDVVVSVPVGSGVLVSTAPEIAGGTSVVLEDVIGTSSPTIYLQGLDLGDGVPLSIDIVDANTTAPAGFDIRPSTVDVDPSGVSIQTPPFSTTTFSPNALITVSWAVLWDAESPTVQGRVRQRQAVRGGGGLSIAMSSSAPSVIALPDGATGSVTGPPGSSSSVIEGDPLTAGVARIAIVEQPPGMTAPIDGNLFIDVTVNAPDTQLRRSNGSLATSLSIGNQLQQFFRVALEVAPPNPVDVTVEIVAASVVSVSTDPTLAGSSSIVFPGVTSSQPGSIYLQGLSLGAATQVRVSAPGYNDWIADVQVVEAGFSISGTATASAGAQYFMQVTPHQLNANGTIAEAQQVRGGTTVDVVVASSDPLVGTIVSPLSFAGGDGTLSTIFDALLPGTTTLRVTQPAGFVAPASGTSLTVQVN